jgi:hypothetical protein
MSDEEKPDHENLLEEAQERFKLASEADDRQREQELEDLRFQVPELQWSEDAKATRRGDALSPARPMLSITQIDAPVRLVRNQARSAKLGVNIHPISEDADEETAEIKQGLYRRIERDSNAMMARMWAFDRALKCGRGYYRVLTRYDEDSPDTFDQEIAIVRILHQDSVYLDPAAQEPDWSDGRFAFVAAWLPLSSFKEQFPDADAAAAVDSLRWESTRTQAPDWTRGGYGKDAAVLVAEYWFKKTRRVKAGPKGREREREEVQVYFCKIAGSEVVEEPTLWPGRYIPIIPILGTELQPFDEHRRMAGMVTNAKDAQRFYNYSASSLVEGMALEPKAPFIGQEGQFEGHEEKWNQANIRNFPYLEYKPKSIGDQPAPPPQRAQVDGTRMSLAVMGMNEARGMVQQTTAVHEPSLGTTPKDERSGRAILALQQQADTSNGDYTYNLEVAMTYEARVVLDLMPHVYDAPGRVTRIIRGDDLKAEPVAINMPFVMQDGRPKLAPQGAQGAKHYDLTKGRYGVNIEIGRSYRTRLQEGDEALTRLVEARPDLMEIIGDIWFNFRDHPGAKEIAKRLTKIREMKYPFLGEGDDGQMTPEQAQAKAAMLQQQVQQLTQQLQGAAQALETDQAKQQATLAKAQMDQQTALAKSQADHEAAMAKTQLDNETKLIIAAAQEETKRLIAGMQAQVEGLRQLVETERAATQQQASDTERREGMAHEVAMRSAEPAEPAGGGEA